MGEWILKVPDLGGEFTFNYELVSFLVVIALLVAGLVICLMGYKYLQTLIIVALGCFGGAVGIKIADSMTQNLILKMCFFVMFTFFSACVFYFISILIVSVLKALRIKNALAKRMYLVAAPIGAGVVGVVTYTSVYRSYIVAAALFVVLWISGTIWGKIRSSKRKTFHTYDELYNMKPLAKEEKEAC